MSYHKTLARKRGKLIKAFVKVFYRNYRKLKIPLKTEKRIMRLEQEISELTAKETI